MEENKVLSEEQFKEYLATRRLQNFYVIHKYKSVGRAIRRGHVSAVGDIYPKRPFHNKANTSSRKGVHSRSINELKKKIYGRLPQS